MFKIVALTLSLALSHALPGQQAEKIQQESRAAQTYLDSGDYPKAEVALLDALAAADPYSPRSARALRNALADLLREEGRLPEARALYEALLHSSGISPARKYRALSGIADIDGMTGAPSGHPDASVLEWNEAIGLARAQRSPAFEAEALEGLAATWLESGNVAVAEPLLRRSLSILESNGDRQPGAIAGALTTLALCYRMQDKLALAEESLTRALAIDRRLYGNNHPQTAYVMNRMAELYADRNMLTEARVYSDQALAVMRAACGPDSPPVAVTLASRAGIEERAKSTGAAASLYETALRIARAHTGTALLQLHIIGHYVPFLKKMHRNREARQLSLLARSLEKGSASDAAFPR